MPAVAPPCPEAVRPSVGTGARLRRGERRQRLPWRAEHEGRPRRGEGVISGQEAEAGSRWGGGGSHAAPRGGRGQRPGRARRTAGCGPDPGLRPTRIPAPASASALHSRAPAPPSLAPFGPFFTGTPPPQTWGKVSQLQTVREKRASPSPSTPSFSSRPPIFGSQAALEA